MVNILFVVLTIKVVGSWFYCAYLESILAKRLRSQSSEL